MRIRLSESDHGGGGQIIYHVKEGTSIVFLIPSVTNPIPHMRFYDAADQLHQVPATQVLTIDPDAEMVRAFRYTDPDTGEVVKTS